MQADSKNSKIRKNTRWKSIICRIPLCTDQSQGQPLMHQDILIVIIDFATWTSTFSIKIDFRRISNVRKKWYSLLCALDKTIFFKNFKLHMCATGFLFSIDIHQKTLTKINLIYSIQSTIPIRSIIFYTCINMNKTI